MIEAEFDQPRMIDVVEKAIAVYIQLNKDTVSKFLDCKAKKKIAVLIEIDGQKREFSFDEFKKLIFEGSCHCGN